jgi:6-phosphofructokinase 1
MASAMGAKAIELLADGKANRIVAWKNGEFVDFDIVEALNMQKDLDDDLWNISRKLCR